MPKSVSLKDVARAAGVSASTVSRALYHHPRISEETANRVRHLAEDMGYTPSLLARSLVTQDTATIGIVLSSVSDPFIGQVVLGAEEVAYRHDYSVLMGTTHRNPDVERELVRSFYGRRASGIVVTGSQIDLGYLQLRELFLLPVVLINCPAYPHSVSADNLSGARQAMEHLVALGHRRIAYISNPQSYNADRERLAGYRAVLAEAGVAVDDSLIVEGDGGMTRGAEAMQQLLALPRPPTAVFCFSDMTAMGVMHALSLRGLDVPGDCSVVGFDDLELASYCCPPLTTVRQPRRQMGQRAMHMLLALMEEEPAPKAEMLRTELVVRNSTGPAPAGSGSGKEVNRS
jgi:LacI family transcriptional regulator, repressor for deo operon, udp, cdd, tsx, nupC, and nupG